VPFNLGNRGSILDAQFEFDVMHRPWTLPMSYIFGYGPMFAYQPGFWLVGYRPVTPERFKNAAGEIPSERVGTIEVMFEWADDADADKSYKSSVFMKFEHERWVVTAHGYWIIGAPQRNDCGWERRDEPLLNYCRLFVDAPPWPSELARFGGAVGQNEPYRPFDQLVKEPR
jgi:hypothetical protein